jgi:hypothetical protein
MLAPLSRVLTVPAEIIAALESLADIARNTEAMAGHASRLRELSESLDERLPGRRNA